MPTQSPLSLADLDKPAHATLSPLILERNLAALQETQPRLATAVSACQPSEGYRPAGTLDGAISFFQPVGGWLAETAAPLRRAIGALGSQKPTGHNFLLPDVGAGRELELLLARLPQDTALFAYAHSLSSLSLILRLISFDREILSARLWFLPPPRDGESGLTPASEELARILRDNPGLLPPASMPQLPWVSGAVLQQLVSMLADAQVTTRAERDGACAEIAGRITASQGREGAIAFLAAREDPLARAIAAQLALAAQQDGLEPACPAGFERATPLNAHPLALLQQIERASPRHIVVVSTTGDATADRLLQLPRPRNCSVLRCCFSATPDEQLRNPNASESRCVTLLPAALLPDEAVHVCASAGAALANLLIVVEPGFHPAPAGPALHPTHAQLWDAASAIFRECAAREMPGSQDLLDRAARRLRIPVEPAARERLLAQFESVLLPRLTFELLSNAEALPAGVSCEVRSLEAHCMTIPAPSPEGGIAVLLAPHLRAFPFIAMSLAVRGWLLAIPQWAQHGCGASLLQPGAHYLYFQSLTQLRQALGQPRSQRISAAQRTMNMVRDKHLMSHRWRTLAAVLGLRPQEL